MADQLRGDALFSYAVEHYLDTVYRAAFHAAPSPQDAEDVAQEVFEALLRSGKRFREPEHLRAWLLRVTINCAKSFMRRPGGGGRSPSVRRWRPPPRRERRSGRSCAACRTSTARCSTSTTTRT